MRDVSRKAEQNDEQGDPDESGGGAGGRLRALRRRVLLTCHRFRSNEARLWLTIIAYNLGNLWRRLVLPQRIGNWSLTSLQQRLVKTGGRLVTTCPLLLATFGRRTSESEAVCQHA